MFITKTRPKSRNFSGVKSLILKENGDTKELFCTYIILGQYFHNY
jgi:hypothetical protein